MTFTRQLVNNFSFELTVLLSLKVSNKVLQMNLGLKNFFLKLKIKILKEYNSILNSLL